MAIKLLNTATEISAANLKEGATVQRFAVQSKHGGGLKLEIRANGLKRFIYRYKLSGKEGELLLGSHPAMSLAAARLAHAAAVALVKQGINPSQAAKEARIKNTQIPTLREVYRDWLMFRAKSKPIGARTLSDYEGTFTRHIDQVLGNVRVCDLSRAMLYEHFRQVDTAEGTRKGLIVLNQCLDHAMLQGYIEFNSARLLKPAMFGASMPPPRERWLTKEELRQLWIALDQAISGAGSKMSGGRGIASNVVLSLSVANCLRLICLTAARRSEAVSMKWEQINGDRWTIPETKNGRVHVVTLCPLVKKILKQQAAISQGQYVFDSTSNSGSPITGNAVTKALERVRVKYMAEYESFSPHDLRRSVATGAAEYLDAPERLIELLLNHVSKDRLIRTYQVGGMADKLRGLFLSWGEFIESVITVTTEENDTGNIVPVDFRRKK
ncbi:tyrosine-type recombinase/integrase [Aeromonas veronii]|uniref:tyrosine-type recombinase/integrase n=1 Tax=Aeromonas veronii TaxID=654 RepID=UPI0032EAAE27